MIPSDPDLVQHNADEDLSNNFTRHIHTKTFCECFTIRWGTLTKTAKTERTL